MLKLEDDGTVTYKGQVVATCTQSAIEDTVCVNLTYKTSTGDGLIPLTWLAHGLDIIEPRLPVALELSTNEDGLEEWLDVPRLLSEKTITRSGYIWRFHKTDPDPWPSVLHGHDYDKGLKLDAISGDIFDVGSKRKCTKLKAKELIAVQRELLDSKDFSVLAGGLFTSR